MKKRKRIKILTHFLPVILLSCFIALIFTGCKSSSMSEGITAPVEISGTYKSETIDPNSPFEECAELTRGQEIEYAFKTSLPVNFNIHYHGVDKIYFPVSKKHISEWKGNFKPDQELFNKEDSQYFCMMWENYKALQVDLTFKYEVKNN